SPLVAVALRDRDDEAEVRLHHLLLRAMLAALDPLRELYLLGGGQQLDLADVLEKELQPVSRLWRNACSQSVRLRSEVEEGASAPRNSSTSRPTLATLRPGSPRWSMEGHASRS